MVNEESRVKKSFWKTPLGVLVIIFFFPFSLTYWVYKQKWNWKIRGGIILGFWLFVLIVGATGNKQDITPEHTAQAPTTSVQHVSPVPTITYPPFDKNLGNNYFAAKGAQAFLDLANKTAPGAVQDIYVELAPEDPQGKTEDAYKKSVSSSFLTIVVTPSFWDSTDDSTKKDFVAALTQATRQMFGGFPHIKVSNSIRTVAEGEWDVWGNEAKVTLK